MKTLHILLKDRHPELQKEVPDSFKFCEPQDRDNNDIFVLPDIIVNLSEVVAMWVTREEEQL